VSRSDHLAALYEALRDHVHEQSNGGVAEPMRVELVDGQLWLGDRCVSTLIHDLPGGFVGIGRSDKPRRFGVNYQAAAARLLKMIQWRILHEGQWRRSQKPKEAR
jgi:hypothetical protein